MAYFSAASLVKSSAKQMVYKNKTNIKETTITPRMLAGGLNQLQVTKDPKYSELGAGIFKDEIDMFYAIDEVILPRKDVILCIEHKFIDNLEIPEWFFHQSIIQTALYNTLVKKTNKLATAKFEQERQKLQMEVENIGSSHLFKPTTVEVLPNHLIVSILQFNGVVKERYQVVAKDESVYNFYMTKAAIVASNDYKKAEYFDKEYKRQEWVYLKSSITFEKIPYNTTDYTKTYPSFLGDKTKTNSIQKENTLWQEQTHIRQEQRIDLPLMFREHMLGTF